MNAPTAPQSNTTNSHYDLPVEVFAAFLDPTLKYSSGLFGDTSDTLHEAQLRKMEFVATELGIEGGERVLDVGCGWGSLTLFLAERYGCTVVGVTPSPHQVGFIRQRARALGLGDLVTIEEKNFDSVTHPPGSFDAITFLGSIIHFPDWGETLAGCYRLCRPRGKLYLSESYFRSTTIWKRFSETANTRFIRDDIFGAAYMVPMSVMVAALEEAGFSLQALHDLTRHYRQTIDHWSENLRANEAEVEAVEPGLTGKFLRYFRVANAGWGFTIKHYAVICTRAR
ncbi:MAG: class I SAM-dependent methyltransferase [Actinobacteria bacterium]|nr:class I SAM-dependent methyltransferase [Actinomycetota bacterium]